MCVVRASASSASARVTTTCARPSAPAAAASAAGVASDSAQGQETTSTAKVTASAREGPCCHHASAVDRGQHQQRADEPRRHAVGDPGDARAVARGAIDEPLDRREPRLGARRGDADHQRAVAGDAAGQHRVALGAPLRPRLAGEDRLLDAGAALDDLAVGRDHPARAHQHDVAGGKAGGADRLGVAARGPARDPQRRRRARPRDAFDRVARAAARDELDVAREQQQRDEHRHRVVIDGAVAAERRPRARHERGGEPERDRHVHAGPQVQEIAPGAAEERRRRVQERRQRQREARPFQQQAVRGSMPSTVM